MADARHIRGTVTPQGRPGRQAKSATSIVKGRGWGRRTVEGPQTLHTDTGWEALRGRGAVQTSRSTHVPPP
eukprot:4465438-Pyramimonas_sp.AAC.1